LIGKIKKELSRLVRKRIRTSDVKTITAKREREGERVSEKSQKNHIFCRVYILRCWDLIGKIKKELSRLVRKRIRTSDVKTITAKRERERERKYGLLRTDDINIRVTYDIIVRCIVCVCGLRTTSRTQEQENRIERKTGIGLER
jgi:hypothetical protein